MVRQFTQAQRAHLDKINAEKKRKAAAKPPKVLKEPRTTKGCIRPQSTRDAMKRAALDRAARDPEEEIKRCNRIREIRTGVHWSQDVKDKIAVGNTGKIRTTIQRSKTALRARMRYNHGMMFGRYFDFNFHDGTIWGQP